MVREGAPEDAAALIAYMTRLCEEDDIDVPLAPGEFTHTVEQEAEIVATYAAADNALFLVAMAGDEAVGVLTLKGSGRKAIHQDGEFLDEYPMGLLL